MLQHFNTQLLFADYDEIYCDKNDINENELEKKLENLNEEDNNDKIILDKIKPFLNEIDNMEEPRQLKSNENINNDKIKYNVKNKRKKNKKMKNYNYRKGDWQCKNCNNINFHFRIICNICFEKKI